MQQTSIMGSLNLQTTETDRPYFCIVKQSSCCRQNSLWSLL